MSGLKVLVFDDDLVSHPSFLGAAAGPGGREVELVYRPNADDAIADVLAVGPALVLMDFSMGTSVDGAAAVRTLRARFPELPIVGISSDARMNRIMIEAGAIDGVPKMALPENLRFVLSLAAAAAAAPDDDGDSD